MRYKGYISVVGTEAVIRALEAQSGVTGAQVKHLTKVTAAVSPTGQAAPWSWATPRADVPEDDPEKGLREMLGKYGGLGAALARLRDRDTHISVVLIAQPDDSEAARGLFLSRETMEQVVRLGAHFELDVVSVIA